jgi:hypothetical protein
VPEDEESDVEDHALQVGGRRQRKSSLLFSDGRHFLKRLALMGLLWNVFSNLSKFVPRVCACVLWTRIHRFGSGFKVTN